MIGFDEIRTRLARARPYERIDIEQCSGCVDDLAAWNAVANDNHRHAEHLLVHRRFAPEPSTADRVTVVARVDHAGCRREATGPKRVEHLARLFVHEAAQSVIARGAAPY